MTRFTLDGLGDADRRSVLKFIGVGGAAAAGTGLGVMSLTGSAAAAEVNITASNPDTAMSDDGEIESVDVAPNLMINWDGFDEVVGKVRVLIEAATGAIDLDPGEIENLEYTPVFRATGYANDTDNDVEQESGPGTNGEFQLDWYSGDEQISVYHEDGGPDYDGAEYNCGATTETYLNGTLMGDPIDGAQNGFYGAAGSTDEFEAENDGGSNVTSVYLRYTITLHRPDASFRTDYNYDLDAEDVRPNSPLAMAGGNDELSDDTYGTAATADEASMYDGLEEGQIVSGTAVPYDMLQANSDHPAIMVDHAQFDVAVENQPADAGVTGDTNPSVSLEEDVGTMTPEDGE